MPYGERATRGANCVQNRTVRFRCSLHNTIFDVLKYMDWIETDGDEDWDFVRYCMHAKAEFRNDVM